MSNKIISVFTICSLCGSSLSTEKLLSRIPHNFKNRAQFRGRDLMEVMFPITVLTHTPALCYQMTTQLISSQRKLSIRGLVKTLPKAQRTRGLSSTYQSNFLCHITSSNTNLGQTSSESQPSINFKISTKHHHFDKT